MSGGLLEQVKYKEGKADMMDVSKQQVVKLLISEAILWKMMMCVSGMSLLNISVLVIGKHMTKVQVSVWFGHCGGGGVSFQEHFELSHRKRNI